LVVALLVNRNRPMRRSALALVIAFLVMFDALWHADLRLNGESSRFEFSALTSGDILMAEPGSFHPPSVTSLAAWRNRLATDQYRSVVLGDLHVVPLFCGPHLGFFWQLRLVDGYSTGIPTRLASLPWPSQNLSLRTLTFMPSTPLPWPLLSL